MSESELVHGVSRAMGLIFAALLEDDAAYRRRFLIRLRRSVKVLAERADGAPGHAVTRDVLRETLATIEAIGESGVPKRRL